MTDALTRLGNRRSLAHAIPRLLSLVEVANRKGPAAHRLALLLIDLDGFKPINDKQGHEAGDQVLAHVGALLSTCVRKDDKVVRWGGDEFVIAQVVSNFKEAAVLAERIRATISSRRFPISATQTARTSVSIGFACYPFVSEAPDLVAWEDVLNIADTALYRAKRTRNSCVGWSGTRAAATLSDLLDRVQGDPEGAERDGYIESPTCAAMGDATAEVLLLQSGGGRHAFPRS